MHDIEYYIKAFETKLKILKGEKVEKLVEKFESFVSKTPTVFAVESTTVCNMKCTFCPRTDLMERSKSGYMKRELYEKILNQIKPLSKIQKQKWERFLSLKLSKSPIIQEDEDFFHFGISSQVLTLHGYGEPIWDKYLIDRLKIAKEKGIPIYFSCNPTNMKKEQLKEILDAGVSFIKYSIDGYDKETLEKYRGIKNKELEDIDKIVEETISMINEGNYSTILVLTMLQFSDNPEYSNDFIERWKDKDVYVYIKNLHNRYLHDEEQANISYDDTIVPENTSHHSRTYCEYPFMSMTIWEDGTVVPCPLDYDGKLAMGNANKETLEDIWNSEKYKEFRKNHVNGNFQKEHFCKKCDIPILGDVVSETVYL